jgi:hypothetical protein
MIFFQKPHLAHVNYENPKVLTFAMCMIKKKAAHRKADEVKSETRGPSFRSPTSLCPTTGWGTSVSNLSSTTEARNIVSVLGKLVPYHETLAKLGCYFRQLYINATLVVHRPTSIPCSIERNKTAFEYALPPRFARPTSAFSHSHPSTKEVKEGSWRVLSSACAWSADMYKCLPLPF